MAMKIGAWKKDEKSWAFRVWSPLRSKVELVIKAPGNRVQLMKEEPDGYWYTEAPFNANLIRYTFRLDGKTDFPDPASHFQPEGVHEASATVDHAEFTWTDRNWRNMPLKNMVIYELHTGTFTPEGTFRAMIAKIPYLKELGINALEIMPVAQFPGKRNWGYDGVYPYAVQNSYGGPNGLKQLIDTCHAEGLAVILDVVYNHLGPEGNYFRNFAPYFTRKYQTPWGEAINFDDEYCDGVRNYFIQNALFWFDVYHLDALRLDAIHAIYDMSAVHFLQELAGEITRFNRNTKKDHYLIAESNLNAPRLVNPPEKGGYGLDAQWSDDFHHSVHALLTGERDGYYLDFGDISHLKKSIDSGFSYDGMYSVFRKRRHGASSKSLAGKQFVVCIQNHDQIGNRLLGERLDHLVGFEARKLAAGALFITPNVPLMFMGEEYGETAPFQYFVSHTDPNLVEAVRKGRKEEFRLFGWQEEPPDPQSEKTYSDCKLNWDLPDKGKHRILLDFYKSLIRLRRESSAMSGLNKQETQAKIYAPKKILIVQRTSKKDKILCFMNFEDSPQEIEINEAGDTLSKRIDSSEKKWNGPGSDLPGEIKDKTVLKFSQFQFAIYFVEKQ